MENLAPLSYFESLKRYWRRRKYRRIYGAGTRGKRKLQSLRLGGGTASSRRRFWRIRRIPKLRWKIVSPIKLLAKLHDAYVDMMICWANKMTNPNSSGGFLRGKKVAKDRQVSVVSFGEEVDIRLLVEIYKKLVASGQLSTEL